MSRKNPELFENIPNNPVIIWLWLAACLAEEWRKCFHYKENILISDLGSPQSQHPEKILILRQIGNVLRITIIINKITRNKLKQIFSLGLTLLYIFAVYRALEWYFVTNRIYFIGYFINHSRFYLLSTHTEWQTNLITRHGKARDEH